MGDLLYRLMSRHFSTPRFHHFPIAAFTVSSLLNGLQRGDVKDHSLTLACRRKLYTYKGPVIAFPYIPAHGSVRNITQATEMKTKMTVLALQHWLAQTP